MTFDTLKAARRLQDEAGFNETQASVLVSTFAQGFGENLATKDDIATLRAEMRALEQRVYVRVGAMITGATVMLIAVIGIATAILLNAI